MTDIVPKLPEGIREFGSRVQELNYKHELHRLQKEVAGETFYTYDLVSVDAELLLTQLLARSASGEVVFDIGANVGHYALALATKGCSVFAFEPDPRAFTNLQRNLRANEADAQSFNFGLSDREAVLEFYLSPYSTRSSFNRYTAAAGDSSIIGTEEIPVKTIDGLVADRVVPPPDHVKIDVEGFGLEVLQGARDTLRQHEPIIYYEPHVVEEGNKRESEVTDFVTDLAYDVLEFDHPSRVFVPR